MCHDYRKELFEDPRRNDYTSEMTGNCRHSTWYFIQVSSYLSDLYYSKTREIDNYCLFVYDTGFQKISTPKNRLLLKFRLIRGTYLFSLLRSFV